MSILSPSQLETMDYDASGWHAIYNANMDKLNNTLLKISGLCDVICQAGDPPDGAILIYDASASKWRMERTGP